MKIIAPFTGLLIRELKYSVFGGVLSVAAPQPRSLGRRGGRGNVIISPIDHPSRGPSTLFGPFVCRA